MAAPVSNEALQEIAALATQQRTIEKEITSLEKRLEELSEKHRHLSQGLIPEAMMSVGMVEFILKDGTRVEIDKFYAAKIPDDQADGAFAWLRKHGFESIIKREVKCSFGKGEDKSATKAMAALIKLGLTPIDKSGVHPQTLKAFVRERMESGEEFPQQMFGVFVGNRTKLTAPK